MKPPDGLSLGSHERLRANSAAFDRKVPSLEGISPEGSKRRSASALIISKWTFSGIS